MRRKAARGRRGRGPWNLKEAGTLSRPVPSRSAHSMSASPIPCRILSQLLTALEAAENLDQFASPSEMRHRREDRALLCDRMFQLGASVSIDGASVSIRRSISEYRRMTDLQRQRSCSVSDGGVHIDSTGGNDHVASKSILYIISYMFCFGTSTVYSFTDIRISRLCSSSCRRRRLDRSGSGLVVEF